MSVLSGFLFWVPFLGSFLGSTSVIIGAKRLDQLQDSLAAVELKLAQDELKPLDQVSALAPEYPGWVLPFQGADRLEPVDRWERFRQASKPH